MYFIFQFLVDGGVKCQGFRPCIDLNSIKCIARQSHEVVKFEQQTHYNTKEKEGVQLQTIITHYINLI